MEEKSFTPESKTTRRSQRKFLLTAIGLLVTLTLSALWVISLLLRAPTESMAVPQNHGPSQTIAPSDKKDPDPLSPEETAGSENLGKNEADEAAQSSRGIITDVESSARDKRIVSYYPGRGEAHRIVRYPPPSVTTTNTISESPHIPHRIIIYDDNQ